MRKQPNHFLADNTTGMCRERMPLLLVGIIQPCEWPAFQWEPTIQDE